MQDSLSQLSRQMTMDRIEWLLKLAKKVSAEENVDATVSLTHEERITLHALIEEEIRQTERITNGVDDTMATNGH